MPLASIDSSGSSEPAWSQWYGGHDVEQKGTEAKSPARIIDSDPLKHRWSWAVFPVFKVHQTLKWKDASIDQ
jgi:hypothetical protein